MERERECVCERVIKLDIFVERVSSQSKTYLQERKRERKQTYM